MDSNQHSAVSEQKGKPKMLFVDDSTRRIHDALRKYGEKYDVTICANVPEALRYLSREDWAVVSLDFDLNGYDFQDPTDKDCGMEIVRYIATTGWPPQKPKPNFVLHSSNAFGAKLMGNVLDKMGFLVQRWRYQYDDRGELIS